MSDEMKARAKAAKKQAKAQAKRDKKSPCSEAEARQRDDPAGAAPPAKLPTTPAEISAHAAERQTRLQGLRVWIALLTLLVAVVTLILTARYWNGDAATETKPTASPVGKSE